jgi:hypothetical protein
MDIVRFLRLQRALAATPSRRAVNRAFAGVATGSVFAPLFGAAGAEAKKKKKKKKNKEQICQKVFGGSHCSANLEPPCCEKGDVCTECGCCPVGYTKCCSPSRVMNGQEVFSNVRCCADNGTCCTGPNGELRCCEPGVSVCAGWPDGYGFCGS